MDSKPAIRDDAAAHVADLTVARLRRALEERGSASLVAAGGSSFRPVYERLAKADLPWGKVSLFFGDERCVPPTDPRSNYGMVHDSLLRHLAKGPRVWRMEGEIDPAQAASAYAEKLVLPFDLVLLGLGLDGHTASLFPQTLPNLPAGAKVVSAPAYQEPLVPRLTLTPLALNASWERIILATGVEKAGIVAQALTDDRATLPISFIESPLWVLDPAAASRLM